VNQVSEYIQSFSVSFEYPVYFGRDMLAPENKLLAETMCRREPERKHRLQVFVDSGVMETSPDLSARITAYFERHSQQLDLVDEPELVPGGEEAKNSRKAAEKVMESIADHHLCRHSYVVAIGGGSVLDIVGLAASLVHRGVRVVRMPTTVLSQGDSGVGVKTGIDAYGVKNFAGTFAAPDAVLVDFDFLRTLPWSYWIGGVTEAFKVAMIRDADFFEFLCENAARLGKRDEAIIERVVERSALLHLEHIRTAGDPFEFGKARPLDFGHWSAHRIEVLSGYEIGHGQAVGIGIALDSFYAWKTGLIGKDEFESVITAFEGCGLPVWAGLLDRRAADGRREILWGLEEFREHLGGELSVTLPAPIGTGTEIHVMDETIIEEGIDFLGARVRGQ
jgi:3-dehydroquinate synthase